MCNQHRRPVSKQVRAKSLLRLKNLLTEMDVDVFEPRVLFAGLHKPEIDKLIELQRLVNSWKFEAAGRLAKVNEDLELEQEIENLNELHECPNFHTWKRIPYSSNSYKCIKCGKVLDRVTLLKSRNRK